MTDDGIERLNPALACEHRPGRRLGLSTVVMPNGSIVMSNDQAFILAATRAVVELGVNQ